MFCLTSHNSLEAGGDIWYEAAEGLDQGDPESVAYFCVAIQEHVIKLNETLQAVGDCAPMGMDDGYAIGPSEVVFTALEHFFSHLGRTCGLLPNLQKTKVYSLSGMLPVHIPLGMQRAGVEMDRQYR